MRLAAPKNIRETLNLFSLVREAAGLGAVLDQVDWSGVTPHQVYYAVLGRYPESTTAALRNGDYNPRLHFEAALRSLEFQRHILWLVAQAYPEKKRVVFLHVPKSAGTDLVELLGSQIPSLPLSFSMPEWTSSLELVIYIRNLICELLNSEKIFLSGHFSLDEVMRRNTVRFGDDFFSVIRNPVDRVMSAINYALGIIFHEIDRPEKKHWMKIAVLEDAQNISIDSIDQKYLAEKLLFSKDFIRPNDICHYFGYGDYRTSIEMVVRSDLEVIDVQGYERWLSARWGICASNKSNASKARLIFTDLSRKAQKFITDSFNDDIRLYEVLAESIANNGGMSVRGGALDLKSVAP